MLDPRQDPSISIDESLFRQIAPRTEYEWLKNRFGPLIRSLKKVHWTLPYYEGRDHLIERDYLNVFQNRTMDDVPIHLMDKMVRLLTWGELQDALYYVRQDPNVFFAPHPHVTKRAQLSPVMHPILETPRGNYYRQLDGYIWIPSNPNDPPQEATPYALWYENGGAEELWRTQGDRVYDLVLANNTPGKVYHHPDHFATLDRRIVKELNALRGGLELVYERVLESFENPPVRVPSSLLTDAQREHFRQLFYNVDMYNALFHECIRPPGNNAEVNRLVDAKVFALHKAPQYVDTSQMSGGRISLLRTDKLSVSEVLRVARVAENVLDDAFKNATLSLLRRDLVNGIRQYEQATLSKTQMDALNAVPREIRQMYADKGVDSIETFRTTWMRQKQRIDAFREDLIETQDKVNQFLKRNDSQLYFDRMKQSINDVKDGVKLSALPDIDIELRSMQLFSTLQNKNAQLPDASIEIPGAPPNWSAFLQRVDVSNIKQRAAEAGIPTQNIQLLERELQSEQTVFERDLRGVARFAPLLQDTSPAAAMALQVLDVPEQRLLTMANAIQDKKDALQAAELRLEDLYNQFLLQQQGERDERLQQEKEERARQGAQRLRKQKEKSREEAERLRKEKADRLRREEEQRNKLAREEEARKKEEQARQEEADRLRKQEDERTRKEEAERLRKEREEEARRRSDRLRQKKEKARQEEAERLRKEEEERNRLAREEEERKKEEQARQEEADRLRKEEEDRNRLLREKREASELEKREALVGTLLDEWLLMPLDTTERRKLFAQDSYDALQQLRQFVLSVDKRFEQWPLLTATGNLPTSLDFKQSLDLAKSQGSYNAYTGFYMGDATQQISDVQNVLRAFVAYMLRLGFEEQDNWKQVYEAKVAEMTPRAQPTRLRVDRTGRDFVVAVSNVNVERELMSDAPEMQMVSQSFQRWENNSCWVDVVFSSLFSIPETAVANALYDTREIVTPVYVLEQDNREMERITAFDRGCTALEIQDLHRSTLRDVLQNQSSTQSAFPTCVSLEKWLQQAACVSEFAVKADAYNRASPEVIVRVLIDVYNLDNVLGYNDFTGDAFPATESDVKIIQMPEEAVQPWVYLNVTDFAQANMQLSVQPQSGAYRLGAVITFMADHYVTYVYDFLMDQWAYFDNARLTRDNASKAAFLADGLPENIFDSTQGERVFGLVYVSNVEIARLLELKIPPSPYAAVLAAIDTQDAEIVQELSLSMLQPEQTYVLMGMHKIGLISLANYAGIVAKVLSSAQSQQDVDRATLLLSVMSAAVVADLRKLLQ